MSMSVFVVLNDGWDEKTAIVHPDIYGPFESDAEAQAFIEQHPRYDTGYLMPMDGGYAAAHIVSAATAADPAVALSEWESMRADDLR